MIVYTIYFREPGEGDWIYRRLGQEIAANVEEAVDKVMKKCESGLNVEEGKGRKWSAVWKGKTIRIETFHMERSPENTLEVFDSDIPEDEAKNMDELWWEERERHGEEGCLVPWYYEEEIKA